MIPSEGEQWGRYNLPNIYILNIYDIYIYIYIYMALSQIGSPTSNLGQKKVRSPKSGTLSLRSAPRHPRKGSRPGALPFFRCGCHGEKHQLKHGNRLVGGWPTPLKNMSSSVRMIVPNLWTNNPCRIHVWNIYQPVGMIWKITLGVNVGKYSSTMDP